MGNVKISYADPRVKQIITDCFPDYKGRKVHIVDYIPSRDIIIRIDSYWVGRIDAMVRDYYVFYSPSTRKTYPVHSNHPFFEQHQPNAINLDDFPSDILLVKRTYFCGKDLGITIHVKTRTD